MPKLSKLKEKLEQAYFPTENQMSPRVQLASAHIYIIMKYKMSLKYVVIPMVISRNEQQFLGI